MRKFILLAIVAIVTTLGASADSGDISLGAQFAYGSKHSLAGLGAQVQIEPIQNWRFAPEFIYYFKNGGISALNVNMNIHYVIPTSHSFAIYPMAGFSYANIKTDLHHGDASVDRCGANVGLGAQYRINERLHFYTEQRFQILKDWNQSVTVLGLKYTF